MSVTLTLTDEEAINLLWTLTGRDIRLARKPSTVRIQRARDVNEAMLAKLDAAIEGDQVSKDFEIVSDAERIDGRIKPNPIYVAVKAGQTVRVPGIASTSNVFDPARLLIHGLRARSHMTPQGLVIWAEKIDEPVA